MSEDQAGQRVHGQAEMQGEDSCSHFRTRHQRGRQLTKKSVKKNLRNLPQCSGTGL